MDRNKLQWLIDVDTMKSTLELMSELTKLKALNFMTNKRAGNNLEIITYFLCGHCSEGLGSRSDLSQKSYLRR